MRVSVLVNVPPNPPPTTGIRRPAGSWSMWCEATNGPCRSTVELLPTSTRKSPVNLPSTVMRTAGMLPASVNGTATPLPS